MESLSTFLLQRLAMTMEPLQRLATTMHRFMAMGLPSDDPQEILTTMMQNMRQSVVVRSVNSGLQDRLVTIEQQYGVHAMAFVLAALFLLLCTVRAISIAIYRLTWHPLARFPGPSLCRISWWPQCYYEAILDGKFLERLPEYHRKYGPVVRINPNEVHIDDASVFHEIYKQNTAFTKDPAVYSLGISNAMTMTIPVAAHKAKRQTLDPCFSKRRVNELEQYMYHELDRVFVKIKQHEEREEEVPIQDLYYCYTGDVISHYLFGKSLNLIDMPDYGERVEQMRSFTRGIWVAIHFQIIRVVMSAMPQWVIALSADAWLKVVSFCEGLSKEAIANFDRSAVEAKSAAQETIFDRMLTDDARRRDKGQDAKPLTFRELADESTAILNAGTEPTATMMAYATYFFLRYPEVQQRILAELDGIVRDASGRLPLQKLESLPFFSGFIRETLRFQPLIPGRLPRVVPEGGLYVPSINDTIPPGTVVGISHKFIHESPDIFPEPLKFLPERWLGAEGKRLEHWLLSFSKGRADCIGKNLAYAEMYIVLGNLFCEFDLQMTPGTHEGMEWVDRVIIHPKKNLTLKVCSKGSGRL